MAKTIGIIPEKIINYKCFIDGEMSPTALVDAELPDIQFMSETISGAGIAGEIDSPTLGHFQSMEIGLNFRTLINKNFHNFTQKVYALEFRAATQSTDVVGGKIQTGKLKISTRVVPKNIGLGKLEVGKPSGSNQKYSCLYLKVEMDGETVLEIDKINMIFNINGEDLLEEVRDAMGI